MYWLEYVELSLHTSLVDLLELLQRKTSLKLDDLLLALLLVDYQVLKIGLFHLKSVYKLRVHYTY